MEEMFSTLSVLRCYNQDQLAVPVNPCGGEVECLHRSPASAWEYNRATRA
jgi:hypothetical protein